MIEKISEVTGYGYCAGTMIPVRSEPSNRSELSTQLLFGEAYSCYESRSGWVRIITAFDNYEGWIDEKQIKILSEEEFQSSKQAAGVSHEVFFPMNHDTQSESFYIPMGSTLPGIRDHYFNIGKHAYQFSGAYLPPGEKLDRPGLIEQSRKYLNVPYLWGGRTHHGIDCSGLAQITYKMAGYQIPRDSSIQAGHGSIVNFLSEAREGDLVFFDNEEGEITHVGILLPDNQIIHSSGKVRIDKIDHQGIFNIDLNEYTHKLRVIKRIVED